MISEEIYKTEVEPHLDAIRNASKQYGFDFFGITKIGREAFCVFDERHKLLSISSAGKSPFSWTIECLWAPDV